VKPKSIIQGAISNGTKCPTGAQTQDFQKEHLQRLNYQIFDLLPEASRRQGI
jgi:hypothetical protein